MKCDFTGFEFCAGLALKYRKKFDYFLKFNFYKNESQNLFYVFTLEVSIRITSSVSVVLVLCVYARTSAKPRRARSISQCKRTVVTSLSQDARHLKIACENSLIAYQVSTVTRGFRASSKELDGVTRV